MALIGAAAALPWHQSGTVQRTGFELARAADRAGLVETGWQRALLVGAALLPLAGALALLASVLGRSRWVGAVACGAAGLGLASAAVVIRLPGGRQAGSAVAIAASVLAAGSGLYLLGRKHPE